MTYGYDAFDHRVRTTVTDETTHTVQRDERALYDGPNLAATFDAAILAVQQVYLSGLGQNEWYAEDTVAGASAGTRWLLTDHQGTVRDVVSTAGTLLDHYVYSSFGRILSVTQLQDPGYVLRMGYTGQIHDAETGLDYYNARYYDPGVGKFISVDPMGFAAGDGNLTRYVINTPITASDASGLQGVTTTAPPVINAGGINTMIANYGDTVVANGVGPYNGGLYGNGPANPYIGEYLGYPVSNPAYDPTGGAGPKPLDPPGYKYELRGTAKPGEHVWVLVAEKETIERDAKLVAGMQKFLNRLRDYIEAKVLAEATGGGFKNGGGIDTGKCPPPDPCEQLAWAIFDGLKAAGMFKQIENVATGWQRNHLLQQAAVGKGPNGFQKRDEGMAFSFQGSILVPGSPHRLFHESLERKFWDNYRDAKGSPLPGRTATLADYIDAMRQALVDAGCHGDLADAAKDWAWDTIKAYGKDGSEAVRTPNRINFPQPVAPPSPTPPFAPTPGPTGKDRASSANVSRTHTKDPSDSSNNLNPYVQGPPDLRP